MKRVALVSMVFLLLGTAVIYAESTSFVGRKIQSQAIVTLDGEQIGSVLILDGVSYAPVRVIAEASGLNAGYKKGEVMLSSSGSMETTTKSVDDLSKERRLLLLRVDFLNSAISDSEYMIGRHTESIKTVDEKSVAFFVDALAQVTKERAAYVAELAEAERRIAEIDNLLN